MEFLKKILSFKLLSIGLLAFVAWSGVAAAEPDLDALRLAAEQGDAEAQYLLGSAYSDGEEVEESPERAARWFRKAAEQGHAGAQNDLGFAYQHGLGVARDYHEAMRLYRESAAQDNPDAMNNIGSMYSDGTGVARNAIEALRWYRKSAEAGDAVGQYNLGYAYETGEGVGQDEEEALKWYEMAAEQELPDAMTAIGRAYAEGRGVGQDYSEAHKWYLQAAELGDAEAQNGIGFLYQHGLGVEQDDAEALKWYHEAAEQGNAAALYNLGTLYEEGVGVEKDLREALKWYRESAEQGDEDAEEKVRELGGALESAAGDSGKSGESDKAFSPEDFVPFVEDIPAGTVDELRAAAERGDPKAQHALGLHFLKSEEVDRSSAEAVKWFRKAAEQGNAAAQFQLGDCSYNEFGTILDYDSAAAMFAKAAGQGYPPAIKRLGDCYAAGRGVEQDGAKGLELHLEAARKGSASALGWLGICYKQGFRVEKDMDLALRFFHAAADHGDTVAMRLLVDHYERAGDEEKAMAYRRKLVELGNAISISSVALEDGFAREQREKEDLSNGFQAFLDKAKAGDAAMQVKVGDCYANGYGVEKNLAEAFSWYSRAAEAGLPEGLTKLGEVRMQEFAYEGDTRLKNEFFDKAKAIELFKKAAESGYLPAMTQLAFAYSDIPEMQAEMIELAQKAAQGGDADGQRLLSLLYRKGEGVERNATLSNVWLTKAVRNGSSRARSDFMMFCTGPQQDIVDFHLNAVRGDAEAMSNLGYYHYMGLGRDQNNELAMEWWRRAAEAGHEMSGLFVGQMLVFGDGVPQDVEEGVKWLRLAADRGNADAEALINRLRAGELEFARNSDPEKAKELLISAAEQNDPDGQLYLGLLLIKEAANEENFMLLHQALGWMELSANQGSEQAKEVLALMKEKMSGEPEDVPVTPSGQTLRDIVDAAGRGDVAAQLDLGSRLHFEADYGYLDLDKAMYWLEKAAGNGDVDAQSLLGKIYGSIPSVKNMEKSLYWQEKAAAQGDVSSLTILGGLYSIGVDVKQDMNRSLDYFTRLLALDPAEGLRGLNAMYATGETPSSDPEEQLEWYRHGAELGIAEAEYRLGLIYAVGAGAVAKDPSAAARWLEKAADQNHPSAQKFLGDFYYGGHGVERDLHKARELYRKAAEQGDEDAEEKVRELGGALENALDNSGESSKAFSPEDFFAGVSGRDLSNVGKGCGATSGERMSLDVLFTDEVMCF